MDEFEHNPERSGPGRQDIMKVTVLVENTACSPTFIGIHGLSMHVETQQHRLLVDLGPDETLLKNAFAAGVDLTLVDTVVISHGHYDHGGALQAFLSVNQNARIYIQQSAFDRFYAKGPNGEKSIGLDDTLRDHPQIILTGDQVQIDDELLLFSGVTGRKFESRMNQVLFMESSGERVPDQFAHEQNLIVTESNRHFLFGGCAHNGIVNILEKAEQIIKGPVDAAIAGFHLHNPTAGIDETPDLIDGIARELARRQTRFLTGHCTGLVPFTQLKERLGDQVIAIRAGLTVEL